MDIETFKKRQEKLGYTNATLAASFKKSEQTISNYRTGQQAIPEHVSILFDQAERQHAEDSLK